MGKPSYQANIWANDCWKVLFVGRVNSGKVIVSITMAPPNLLIGNRHYTGSIKMTGVAGTNAILRRLTMCKLGPL